MTVSRRSLTRRRVVTASGAALAVPFLGNATRAESGSIKVGFPVPLTGPYCPPSAPLRQNWHLE